MQRKEGGWGFLCHYIALREETSTDGAEHYKYNVICAALQLEATVTHQTELYLSFTCALNVGPSV